MKNTRSTWLIALTTLALFTVTGSAWVFADDDDDDGPRRKLGHDLAPVTDPVYQEECGSCHMAYQPGLLPASAWAQLMTPEALAAHFGDDASLADDTRTAIVGYLSRSADGGGERSRSFAVGGGLAANGERPRITTSPYFVKKHDEIPARLVTGNPDVGSFSQCNTCHRGAADGDYNERRINIPGYGPWED